ncbi:hypothetical protein [Yersinia similis]|uniref:Uncharacterized protein n=1 Tax=Yersinia similis TaxID=367190 RepID=A0A0T9RBJ1_9GAMM|nr:hypothetical protein [Yersinia similis]AHK21921.1 hypothetical protein BF17_04360 [Yersinia similis]CFQ73015.1 Uncharacterised protein [Yersinia similis]CNB83497.1 Uncharacterised protein [Yersinia similis]CNF35449.1 Uncharacterised protein [Yersinia similis]CNG37654.1 Uncharacterised protein [Yersinia similis]
MHNLTRRTYQLPLDPQTHAVMTADLLACAYQLSLNGDDSTTCFIESLIAVAAERAKNLADMLEVGAIREVRHV